MTSWQQTRDYRQEYDVKVDGKAETLARTGVSPASAAYLEYHFMVSIWKIGHTYRFHESFGLKMDILRKRFVHQFIQTDMYLDICLCQTNHYKVIKAIPRLLLL